MHPISSFPPYALCKCRHGGCFLFPAGGGYLQVYTAGDYVYVGDSDAFDANIGANPGLTIEMWIYQKRSMVDLEPRAVNRRQLPRC